VEKAVDGAMKGTRFSLSSIRVCSCRSWLNLTSMRLSWALSFFILTEPEKQANLIQRVNSKALFAACSLLFITHPEPVRNFPKKAP
jgi:hypothetical protein